MMLKIKFKFWDLLDNKMWSDLDLEEHTLHSIRDWEGYLLQYTGLKDKDKKEIYEGDILKTGTDEMLKVFFNTSTGSFDVEFLGGDCERLIGEDGWKEDLKEYKYKIIGNIYENSDLLK